MAGAGGPLPARDPCLGLARLEPGRPPALPSLQQTKMVGVASHIGRWDVLYPHEVGQLQELPAGPNSTAAGAGGSDASSENIASEVVGRGDTVSSS